MTGASAMPSTAYNETGGNAGYRQMRAALANLNASRGRR